MILTEVVKRLNGLSSIFASVEGAEELESLGKGTAPQHGTVFVLPFEERAEQNELITGAFRQQVNVQFLVAVVIRLHGDARGAGRIEASDRFSAAIEASLAGWCWDREADPAELVASRAAPAGNGVTWFVQTWRTTRWIGT